MPVYCSRDDSQSLNQDRHPSTDRWMGEDNRVLTYIQEYSSDIKNEMMSFVGKWMER